jgi:hypothetical protein
MYHRPIVTSTRFPELIENLKAEFETLAHDVTVYKNQRDEYERKRMITSFETRETLRVEQNYSLPCVNAIVFQHPTHIVH